MNKKNSFFDIIITIYTYRVLKLYSYFHEKWPEEKYPMETENNGNNLRSFLNEIVRHKS